MKAQVDDCKSNLFSELAIKEEAGFKVASKQVLSVRQEEGVDVEEALLLLATLKLSTCQMFVEIRVCPTSFCSFTSLFSCNKTAHLCRNLRLCILPKVA